MLFLNSGADRVLALNRNGKIVRDTGPIEGLNPGGGNFGPDGRYYVARTITALAAELTAVRKHILPAGIMPFSRGFAFGRDGRLFLASGIDPDGRGDAAIFAFTRGGIEAGSTLGWEPYVGLDGAIIGRKSLRCIGAR